MQSPENDQCLPRIAGPVRAAVLVPGSKSLANRALLLAALADGRSELTHLPSAGDTTCMVDALTALGVSVRYQPSSGSASIDGVHGLWRADDVDLDVRDAGTVYRFVTAAACIGRGRYRIDGTPRIRERPIGGLVEALRSLGARVDYDDAPGRCPLSIDAAGLDGGTVHLTDPASSQFLSALLMAAPLARRDVFIEVSGALRSRPYIDLTRRVMEAFGVSFIWDDQNRFVVPGNQHYQATAYAVEPDASGAAYFWGLAAITGGRVQVNGVSRTGGQPDLLILDLLAGMGCQVEENADGIVVQGAPDGRLRGFDADLSAAPDLAPTLAALAVFAEGDTRLRGVAHLRWKESDRIHAIAHNAQRLGAEVEIHDDGLTIRPAPHPTAIAVDTFDDHRIAMSFSLAAARLDGMTIRNAQCVRKSFPNFFELFRQAADTATRS